MSLATRQYDHLCVLCVECCYVYSLSNRQAVYFSVTCRMLHAFFMHRRLCCLVTSDKSCLVYSLLKDVLRRDIWDSLLANKVHIQGMEVLLADKMYKLEPQCKWLYISHNHLYINSSKIMWHLPCHRYLCRDGCVKCIAI